MRVFAPVMAAGMVWMMSGCGRAIVPAMGAGVDDKAATGFVLADSVTSTHYSLIVANGAPVLTQMNTAAAANKSDLLDGVNGARYLLGVTNGALTLTTDATLQPGSTQIALVDTVTAKTYELAVMGGSLTLTAKGSQ